MNPCERCDGTGWVFLPHKPDTASRCHCQRSTASLVPDMRDYKAAAAGDE